jgi:hypothetical protein
MGAAHDGDMLTWMYCHTTLTATEKKSESLMVDDERAWRVADAVASGRLDGIEPSPAFLADAELFVEGEIDGDELVVRARRRWGLEPAAEVSEAQGQYDSSPELRSLLNRAARSPTVRRRRAR